MKLGLENFLDKNKESPLENLKKKRIGLLFHPASVDRHLNSSLDLLLQSPNLSIEALFSPQHGFYGEKQDNMIESPSFVHPDLSLPVFSLYDKNSRRLNSLMKEHFDLLIFDLQDIGSRVYTFLSTLFYILEDCAEAQKEVWVFDRPNPIGRPVEGIRLNRDFFSFVGLASLPMRHGLTLGEAARWYENWKNLNLNLTIWPLLQYGSVLNKDFGWPVKERAWVNPSPNIPRLSSARAFPGTVLIEGTSLSEGRGTTRPLEIFGAPDIDSRKILERMHLLAPKWLEGCRLRPCFFEPSFHKHKHKRCSGLQIHVDSPFFDPLRFKPFRLVSLYLKSLRQLYSDYPLWRSPPYEYEEEKLPIDLISGSSELREWVDDLEADMEDFSKPLLKEEKTWEEERREFLLYPSTL